MVLRLKRNPCIICKYQGKRYSNDLRYEKDLMIIYFHKRLDELIYNEVLATREEESKINRKKHEKTYEEFIESLKKIRMEREQMALKK